MKHTITTPDDGKNRRVDKFISDTFNEYSRSALVKLFDLNLIKLNGEPIQPGFKLKPNTTIEYDLAPLQAKPEVIKMPIIYEDSDIVVINKPAGVISHARGKFWQEASVASFIRDKIATELDDGQRGGIVHRLDRATSGVMVCAKNESALKHLQKQFSDRKVDKTYIALVSTKPKDDNFIIDAPIMRDPKTPKRFIVDKEGKPSQTRVDVIWSTPKRTTLLLKPKTGRTHQLRVHLNYVNNPIVGDPLYGQQAHMYDEHSQSLRLHSYSIAFDLNGKKVNFSAPIPDYWSLNLKFAL
jgi:23S rRNA pseudouridine1911/1915/1917 synthase